MRGTFLDLRAFAGNSSGDLSTGGTLFIESNMRIIGYELSNGCQTPLHGQMRGVTFWFRDVVIEQVRIAKQLGQTLFPRLYRKWRVLVRTEIVA
jgi:hypothetical protein